MRNTSEELNEETAKAREKLFGDDDEDAENNLSESDETAEEEVVAGAIQETKSSASTE